MSRGLKPASVVAAFVIFKVTGSHPRAFATATLRTIVAAQVEIAFDSPSRVAT